MIEHQNWKKNAEHAYASLVSQKGNQLGNSLLLALTSSRQDPIFHLRVLN